jgi:hypothetical protein
MMLQFITLHALFKKQSAIYVQAAPTQRAVNFYMKRCFDLKDVSPHADHINEPEIC